MSLRVLHVVAITLVALCLVPTGAHLFAMPNKMAMDQADYFTAQQIYNGWALFGIVQAAALVACLWLAWGERGAPMAMGFAASAAGLIVAALVAFFALTFPGNAATENWKIVPENWESLRLNWEIGHASGAVLTFLALVAATISAVSSEV